MATSNFACTEAVTARAANPPVAPPIKALAQRIGWRRAAWGVAGICATAGFLATSPAASDAALRAAGRDLALLLRFMALVKAGFALAMVALAAWRLRFPVRPGVAAAYVAACALMPAGAALIWHLAHVAAGAALFHAGLITMLVLFWRDQDGATDFLPRALRSRANAD